MNWLKTFWNKLVNKTSVSSTLVLVEEECSVVELFLEVCTEAGVGSRILDSTNAVEKFEDWYTGPASKESIAASLKEFIKTDSVINAKLQRFVK
jgi:hypothetical protein